ncbi:hypothetical protein AAFF_G00252160 [Aldrovandia affinis]|uniref:Uncharacterized protein n=1 Tax=Aldrovandia affinis TaxID=143900 RepID=A0AAD7WT82_9TELE|nr:hypothetical protein AAFF_G00252160 [Aldrovandia affinis]
MVAEGPRGDPASPPSNRGDVTGLGAGGRRQEAACVRHSRNTRSGDGRREVAEMAGGIRRQRHPGIRPQRCRDPHRYLQPLIPPALWEICDEGRRLLVPALVHSNEVEQTNAGPPPAQLTELGAHLSLGDALSLSAVASGLALLSRYRADEETATKQTLATGRFARG